MATIYQIAAGNSNDIINVCDFNGDGISDYMIIPYSSNPYVRFGTGTGITSGSNINNAPGYQNQLFFPPNDEYAGHVDTQIQYLITDANGDGKSDLVYLNSSINPTTLLGTMYMSAVYGTGNINAISSMPQGTLIPGNVNMPTGLYYEDKSYLPEFSTGDFDGDGNQDVLFKRQAFPYDPNHVENPNWTTTGGHDLDARWIVNPYAGNASHLASTITNGNNVTVNFTYNTIASIDNSYFASNTNPVTHSYIASKIYSKGTNTSTYPIIQIQKPITVVTSVSVPTAGETNFLYSGSSATTYTYADAQIQAQGRGFLGYSKIIENNDAFGTNITKSFGTISKVVSSSQTIIEKVPTSLSTVYTYTLADELTNGWYQPIIGPYTSTATYAYSIFPLSTSSLQHFTGITNKSETDYTGANTVTTYTYDNNVTSPTNNNVTNTYVNIAGNLETYSITNTYQAITSFPGIPCRLSSKKTIMTRSGQPDYPRDVTYEYTNEGSVLKTHFDPDIPNTTGTGGQKNIDITYTYDTGNHGVVTQKQAVYNGTGGVTKTTNYTYDANFRYPITEINPLNQTTEVTYDSKWGKPLTLKGVDNLITSYTYDGYGKNIRIVTPDGLNTTTTYDWVQPGETSTWGNDPVNAAYNLLYKTTTESDGKPTIICYNDIYNRPVKTITDGFNGTSLNVVRSYDPLGNVYQQSNAYDPANPAYKPTVTLTLYDNLNNLQIVQTQDFKTPIYQIEDYSNDIRYSYSYSSGTKTVTKSVTAATGNKTSILTYDATGALTSSTGDGPSISYSYWSHNNPKTISVTGGTTVNFTYDAYARKATMQESNLGTTTYDYNALGLLNTKTDNSNQTYNYYYDVLDRMTSMSSGGDQYTYQYVSSGSGVNQLQKVNISGSSNIEYDYIYDALNRQIQESEILGGQAGTLTSNFTYDQFNNITKVTYPGGNFSINRIFDQKGYLKQVTRGDNNNSIWQATTMNAMGQYDNYTLGSSNNINVSKTFTSFGLLNNTIANTSNGVPIQNLTLVFDQQTGNLTSRADAINGQTESFVYDVQDRLNTYGTGLSTYYSANGNISTKSDIGIYTYDNTLVNALTSITNLVGNPIPAFEQNITFNSFDKPQNISEGTNQANILYGPNQQRTEMDLSISGAPTNKIYYLTNYEMQVDLTNNTTTQVHYINAGDGLCAMYVLKNGVGNLYYVFKDHLGSILKLTDENGTKIAEQSFDAWGANRNPVDWTYDFTTHPPIANPYWLIRGFTGHEHLPQFSLINMNGRVYDPKVARVLSDDDNVDDGTNAQAYNRYSYCINNPLKYTDPSGEDFGWDDALVLGVGFLFGDIAYSVVHNVAPWNGGALAAGGVDAVVAEVGYLTFGGGGNYSGTGSFFTGAEDAAGEELEAASFSINFTADAAVNISTNANQLSSSNNTTNFWLQAGYEASAAFQAGLTSDDSEAKLDKNLFGYKEGDKGYKIWGGLFSDFWGGFINGGATNILESYSPATNSWQIKFTDFAVQADVGGLSQATQKLVGNAGFDQFRNKDEDLKYSLMVPKAITVTSVGQVISTIGTGQNWSSQIFTPQSVTGWAGSYETDLLKFVLEK
jgi:RHS repeat-associated protein